MSIELRVAGLEQLSLLVHLVTAYHEFEGIEMSEEQRQKSISGLLTTPSLGRIWLIYTGQQPVGYIALTFGYSLEFGGKDAFIDELYIRPDFRRVGLGTETLKQIQQEAAILGIHALHLEVSRTNLYAKQFYSKLHFHPRDKYMLMSMKLGSFDEPNF